MNNALDTIFSTEIFNMNSIEHYHLYHLSSHLERRLEITEDGSLQYRRITLESINDKFEWLKQLSYEAPYEADLFKRILSCQYPFFVLQGGSGSGKSSCIRYLVKQGRELAPKGWLDTYSLSSFITRIDLNKDISYTSESDNPPFIEGEKRFYNEVSRLFLFSVNELIDVDLSQREIKIGLKLQEFANNGNENSLISNDIRWLCEDIALGLSEIRGMIKSQDIGKKIYEKIEAAEGVEKFQIILRLAIFVSTWIREKRNVIICFDNSDRIDIVYLTELLLKFRGLVENDYLDKLNLKVFFYVRRSTRKDHADAFQSIRVKGSSTVHPINAILSRSISYLLSERRKKIYKEREPIAKEVDIRLFELMVSLTEPLSPHRAIIEGLAGSNIRHAFYYVNTWLAHDLNFVTRFTVDDAVMELSSNLRILLFKLSVNEYLVYWFENLLDLYISSGPSRKYKIDSLVDHIELLFGDLSPLFHSDDVSDSSIGFKQHGVLSKLEISPHELKALRDEFMRDFAFGTVIIGVERYEKPVNKLPHEISRFFKEVSTENAKAHKHISRLPDIGKTLEKAQIFSYSPFDLEANGTKFSSLWSEFTPQNKARTPPTRYESTMSLLDSINDGGEGGRPINLFSSNEDDVDLIALWILSISHAETDTNYGRRSRGTTWLTGDQINSIMSRFDVDEMNVKRTLLNLTNLKNRMLVSSLYDQEYLSDERWKNTRYSLTWGGKLYYEKLPLNLYYVEWCIFNTTDLSRKYFNVSNTNEKSNLVQSVTDQVDAERTKRFDVNNTALNTMEKIINCCRYLTFEVELVSGGTPMLRTIVWTLNSIDGILQKNYKDQNIEHIEYAMSVTCEELKEYLKLIIKKTNHSQSEISSRLDKLEKRYKSELSNV